MTSKDQLAEWIVEALRDLAGEASIVDISRHMWEHHEQDLRSAGDLFYRWQYEMRWVAQNLQSAGIIRKQSSPRTWILLK